MSVTDAPPARVTAGDTWSWRWASGDYPAPTWTNAWRVVGPGVTLAVSAVAEGTGFLATAAATATAALTIAPRGVPCTLLGWVTQGAQRFEIYRAPLLVLPDAATATGDLRGHAAVTLAAIDALLEGRATKDQESYKIGERELKRIPVAELLRLRDYYRAEARREADAAALASGQARPRVVLTRMIRG